MCRLLSVVDWHGAVSVTHRIAILFYVKIFSYFFNKNLQKFGGGSCGGHAGAVPGLLNPQPTPDCLVTCTVDWFVIVYRGIA